MATRPQPRGKDSCVDPSGRVGTETTPGFCRGLLRGLAASFVQDSGGGGAGVGPERLRGGALGHLAPAPPSDPGHLLGLPGTPVAYDFPVPSCSNPLGTGEGSWENGEMESGETDRRRDRVAEMRQAGTSLILQGLRVLQALG